LKPRGFIEGTDMEMHFRRLLAFAGRRRPAFDAEAAQPAGRRIELGYLTFGNDISGAFECHKDGDGCPAVFSTTLAMAPRHGFRLTGRHEAHGAAQAATLKLIAHALEPSLPSLMREGYYTTTRRVFPA
jgi:hypothetical protein